jgi:hypothetical protein
MKLEKIVKSISKNELQSVFDRVCNHLLTQMERSTNEKHCLYHSGDGLKCAVGVLIEDKHYYKNIEGSTLYNSDVNNSLQKSGINVNGDDKMFNMLEYLQQLHDNSEPCQWRNGLKSIAIDCDLNFNFGSTYV